MSSHPYRRSALGYVRLALLIAVPVLALAGWDWLHPSDRMTPEATPYATSSLLYDEFDLSAMALRGLNAELGRQAGAPSNPRPVRYDQFALTIEAPRPAKARYFLEYPHAVLLLFRAGYWIQPGWRATPIPPGLPDCGYHNIASHDPENEDQFATFKLFAVATRFYAAVMFIAWILLIVVLEWGYGPGTELHGGALLLLLPAAVFFTLNRFDILPALFTALSFACLGRRRIALAAVTLGLATLLKVYPILFAPLVLRYLWPQRRSAGRFAAVYAAMGLLAFVPLAFGDDWTSLMAPYKFQLTRPPEHGLTIYGCLLPVDLAEGVLGGVFRLAALAGAGALMMATPIRDLTSLLRRCGVVLMVFVSLSVFYSPQWILWFAPLVPPLVRRDWQVGLAGACLDVVNYLTFPVWYFVLPLVVIHQVGEELGDPIMTQFGNSLRLVRFLCSAYLLWRLLWPEYPWRDWFNRLWRRTAAREPVFAGQ